MSTRARSVNREVIAIGGLLVCVGAVLVTTVLKPGWYILPSVATIALCAMAISRLPKSHFGLFDPRLITWLVLLYSQGLSFILNVLLDYYWSVTPIYYSADQLLSFTAISASISFVGVVIFFALDGVIGKRLSYIGPSEPKYEFRPQSYRMTIAAFVALALAVQAYIIIKFGGPWGYLRALSEERDSFSGFGFLYLISESLPVLLMFLWVGRHLVRGTKPSWQEFVIALFAFVILKLLFGGLRGSRSNTVWGLFWFLCVAHIFFLRIRLAGLTVAAGFVLAFVVMYSAYKTYGYQILSGDVELSAALETSGRYDGRATVGVMLEDFSRSGAQTLVVAQSDANEQYKKKNGETYVGALALLLPRAIFPQGKPDTKIQAGSELLYGNLYYATRERGSSRIYGLFGEAVLNFGVILAPAAILFFALFYRGICKFFYALHPRDPRLLACPLAVNALFIAIVSDSDNLVFFLTKNGALPILCLLLVCRRRERKIHHAA